MTRPYYRRLDHAQAVLDLIDACLQEVDPNPNPDPAPTPTLSNSHLDTRATSVVK